MNIYSWLSITRNLSIRNNFIRNSTFNFKLQLLKCVLKHITSQIIFYVKNTIFMDLLIDLHFQIFLFSVFISWTADRLPKYERNIRLKRFMENGETAGQPKLYEIYLTFKFRFPTFRFCILTGNGYCYWW